jgi:hypothetical protein
LKAYAAGLADVEQQRQARQHLSHCRHCREFVGKLSGQLHDMGSSLILLGGLDAIGDGRLSLVGRFTDAVDRARESAANALAGVPGDGAGDVVTRVATLPGGARGAGAAGTGVLAKLAGLGTAGKLAAVCLGGGAAATACAVTGIVPVELRGRQTAATNPPAAERPVNPRATVGAPADQLSDDAPPPPPASGEVPADLGTPDPAPEGEAEPAPAIAPSAPPGEQEFGVASAAPEPATASHPSPSGGGGSAAQQEFGP